MTDYIIYTLHNGNLLHVPTTAKVQEYRPIGAPSERTPKAKRRKQRHPRTPNRWWERRRLALAEGAKAAAEAEGVSVAAILAMAKHYHWKLPNGSTGGSDD
jgi:hypothetical protein